MGRDFSFTSVVADASPYSATRAHALRERPVHVLTLTPFYPTVDDDARGCFVAEALPSLAEQGVENTVIAAQPFYRGRVATCEATPAKCVRYFSLMGKFGLSTSGMFLFSRIMAEVRRLHQTHHLDLIHAHAALPCGHAAALIKQKLGIPYIVTVHGLDAFSVNQAGRLAGPGCQRVSEMVYTSASRVIGVSQRVSEQVTSAGANVTTIHNGVDSSIFAPGRADEMTPGRILSVGNLIAIKGHELLLRAIALSRGRCPHLECDIIGDGPCRGHLQSLVARLGIASQVRFLGRRSRGQVADAMRSCAIFALPSRYEALGCVYLEAMSTAKPIIACRGQGIEEIIHHGINGLLVGSDDVEELAESLLYLLQNDQLRRRLGGAARQTILKEFTLRHQAQRLSQVYRECAA